MIRQNDLVFRINDREFSDIEFRDMLVLAKYSERKCLVLDVFVFRKDNWSSGEYEEDEEIEVSIPPMYKMMIRVNPLFLDCWLDGMDPETALQHLSKFGDAAANAHTPDVVCSTSDNTQLFSVNEESINKLDEGECSNFPDFSEGMFKTILGEGGGFSASTSTSCGSVEEGSFGGNISHQDLSMAMDECIISPSSTLSSRSISPSPPSVRSISPSCKGVTDISRRKQRTPKHASKTSPKCQKGTTKVDSHIRPVLPGSMAVYLPYSRPSSYKVDSRRRALELEWLPF